MIDRKFELTSLDVDKFKEDGYLVLRNFFSERTIEHFQRLAEENIQRPETNYGSGFSKLNYDIGNNDEQIFDLIQNSHFKDTLYKLTNRELIFTQGLAFELEKNKSSGFPWHVGTQSFGFHQKDDFACTIWIPFCEINANEQRGGMAYVSKKHMSGEFVYQYINLIPDHLKKKKESEDINFEYFSRTKNNILNLPEISGVLTHYASEDHFSIKDAIIFDKYVIHRSVKLEEGSIDKRVAFALRFADVESKYDSFRANQLEYPKHAFNYEGSSDFNTIVCKEDGQPIIDSHLFKDNLQKRIVRGN